MRTFAQKQNQKPVSSNLARPNKKTLGPDHHEQPILRVQRTIDNQAVQSAAPPIVHDVLSSPGQPLEPAARRFMETRFSYDFHNVRIHTDARAVASADAVNAHAYTVGDDIVFGQSAYAPGTEHGRSLLAHELAHIVQQQHTPTSPHAPFVIGNQSDQAEQEAEAVARAVRPTAHIRQQSSAFRSVSQSSMAYPMLQRVVKTVPTWAGQFIADEYDPEQGADNKEVNGAAIKMHFKPNSFVDAKKISFVQTAQSLVDGRPYNKYDKNKKEQEVAESRMIPGSQPGKGAHIDQMPYSRTPLYSMKDTRGNDLSNPEPNAKYTEIGWHFTDARGALQEHDAMLYDDPNLVQPSDKQVSQTFETAALAIAGNQKGVFYGSVEWGWKMNPGDAHASLIEFKAKSKDAPSPIFKEAATLWNASLTSENKQTIDVPSSMLVISEATALWDALSNGKKIGTLAKNTRLGLTEKREPNNPAFWLNVIVVSGPLIGKVGWVQGTMTTTEETQAKPKK